MTETAVASEPPLTYPIADAPGVGDGSVVEIATGFLWLRMPLGGSLRFINVWALADGDGWTIVDTGMRTEATMAAWETALAGPLGGRPIHRVIGTHLHPDHIGLAGWFAERRGAELWMSRADYLLARLILTETKATETDIGFARRCGWDDAQIARYVERFGRYNQYVHPLPDRYRRLRDGDRLRIGDHEWTAIEGSGHAPEHICLYDQRARRLISGDQVLPKISSNVSVSPREPEADPLGEWLASLARLKTAVPDKEVLVLPAHNDPFVGLHARLDELTRRHHEGLDAVEALLVEPRRTIDVFPALFFREITADVLGLATGEAMAHLAYLVAQGRAERTLDADGIAWFSKAGHPNAAGPDRA